MRFKGNLSQSLIYLSVRKLASAYTDVPFSKSPAFSGGGFPKEEYSLTKPLYLPDYYDSVSYKLKRLASFLISLTTIFVYVGVFREPNDIDELLDAPPGLLSANIQRSLLREKIRQNRTEGKNTELLEAELQYVDVKEAAMRSALHKNKG